MQVLIIPCDGQDETIYHLCLSLFWLKFIYIEISENRLTCSSQIICSLTQYRRQTLYRHFWQQPDNRMLYEDTTTQHYMMCTTEQLHLKGTSFRAHSKVNRSFELIPEELQDGGLAYYGYHRSVTV